MKTTKYCPACKKDKAPEAFHCDNTRSDGLHGECRECRASKRRKKYRILTTRGIKRHLTPHMMGDELFETFYKNPDLHEYINRQVKRLAKRRKDVQESFKGAAWIRIAMLPSGQDIEALKLVALRAIQAAYRKRLYRYRYDISNDLELMSREEYEMWRTGVSRV